MCYLLSGKLVEENTEYTTKQETWDWSPAWLSTS